MTDVLKDIPSMTKEELQAQLDALRESRRKGYEAPVHKVRRDSNPFSKVDPKVLEQVLAELERRKEETV